MIAGLLVDAGWGCRQFIVETVLSERNPHVAGVSKPVQQQNRRAVTTDPDVLSASANLHLLVAKS
jgi:hypothetical protein